ncbi:MAG: hypothetical protein V2J25_08480 [Desulfatiglans sp.]|jgi:general secretion pathway protein M|nr:hypothetical protein [Thermodesulfobacteriota bacterium]MEE4352891.1 hypothetical protein [Desulfatiglans sp.]
MKLARREKYIVILSACVVGLFVIFQFVIFPFFEKRDSLRRGVIAKEEGLKEIVLLKEEYESRKGDTLGIRQVLDRRKKGFTLFSFLERAAGVAEVKNHIKYMKPSVSRDTGPHKESMVEMKLEGITLKQLVGYLYYVESEENAVSIKRLSIKKNTKESDYLDAVLQVLTYDK